MSRRTYEHTRKKNVESTCVHGAFNQAGIAHILASFRSSQTYKTCICKRKSCLKFNHINYKSNVFNSFDLHRVPQEK